MNAPHRVVIVGAGFAGVYCYRNLHRLLHGRKNIHLTLVSETNYFLFTPLLHEVATGGIAPENIIEPLRDVVGCCLDEFNSARAQSVSFKKKSVETAAGSVPYDTLVLALGAETNFMGTPGAADHCFQLKNLADALALKRHIIASAERFSAVRDAKKKQRMLTFAIVGGGATGVELACELSDFVRTTLTRYYGETIADASRIILLQAAGELVPAFPKELRTISAAVCKKKKIAVRLNTIVSRVASGAIECESGERVETDCAVWVAGVKARTIACDDEQVKNEKRAFAITPTLQLERYAEVFAVGDCARVTADPAPLAAQAAVQQAVVLAQNIINRIDGLPLSEFHYRSFGTLLSLGDYHAAGKIGNLVFSGAFCWWLWRTVYLFKMPTFKKKVKVAVDWTFDLFLPRDVSTIE